MQSQQEQYNELSYYTLAHRDPAFIHQYIVDAYTAQTANEKTKSIAIIFALAGLYLHLEKNFTGKQVQNMHILMAKREKKWPKIDLPKQRGEITVADVLAVAEGTLRDKKITAWCISVWNAYEDSHNHIADILSRFIS